MSAGTKQRKRYGCADQQRQPFQWVSTITAHTAHLGNVVMRGMDPPPEPAAAPPRENPSVSSDQ